MGVHGDTEVTFGDTGGGNRDTWGSMGAQGGILGRQQGGKICK